MKENFYIFLDIDGVMYDWDFIKSLGRKNLGIIDIFNPKSVFALNYLIQKLSNKYNTELVISSTWRSDLEKTINVLAKNGVKVNSVPISRTKITNTPQKRGLEILEFLNSKGYTNNFVIIDDESFDFNEHFSKKKIIKTNIFKDSLKKNMVDEFLESIGFDINTQSEIYNN